jgi:O-antigen/teichoic acid export membrane protein
MENNTLTMTIRAAIETITSPLLVILGLTISGALIGRVLGYLFASIIGSIILFKYYKTVVQSPQDNFMSNVKVMLSYSYPLYFSTLLVLFLNQYKNIILAFYASDIEIGNMNVTTTLHVALRYLTLPLSALFPSFSKANPTSSAVRRLFTLSVKYIWMLFAPISMFIIIESKDIVHLIYGQRYDLAPLYLSLDVLVFLYLGIGYLVIDYLLYGIGETKTMFKGNLAMIAAFIPLAPGFMLLLGVPGLIIAFLISTFASILYKLYIIAKKVNIYIKIQSSFKIFLTTLLSAIPILIFLQTSPFEGTLKLVVNGIIFFWVYLTIVPVFKIISREEMLNLKTYLKNIKLLQILTKPIMIYEETILKIMEK